MLSILFVIIMNKINRIAPDKHDYLQVISSIAKVPKVLYYRGSVPDSRIPTVAIVGTRKPTAYGKEVAFTLARDLAGRGIAIISGLALGIDAIAHRGALDVGGRTLAILANGVEKFYPATNAQLAEKIIKSGGAIISEHRHTPNIKPYQFLERNRIISGLSDAVIVIEAATRSGTLSTVSHALEQGREVFVVPGNITSPLSAGCNALLKQGAHPITSASDVLEVVAPRATLNQGTLALGSTPLEDEILSLIRSGVRDGDELQKLSSASVSEFSQALTMLEINDVIKPLGGNHWALK